MCVCVSSRLTESAVNQCPLVLQHEKYSSQLQMNLKVLEVKKEAEERLRSSKSLPQGEPAVVPVTFWWILAVNLLRLL